MIWKRVYIYFICLIFGTNSIRHDPECVNKIKINYGINISSGNSFRLEKTPGNLCSLLGPLQFIIFVKSVRMIASCGTHTTREMGDFSHNYSWKCLYIYIYLYHKAYFDFGKKPS